MQLQARWGVGELVWVERHSKGAQFRVVWVSERGVAGQAQIGLECIEPRFDWGMKFSPEADIAIDYSEEPAPWFSKEPKSKQN